MFALRIMKYRNMHNAYCWISFSTKQKQEQKLQLSPEKTTQIDRTITEMMATDYNPFYTVEKDGFKRLMALLEPRYQLKQHKYYSNTMLEKVYKGLHTAMEGLLAQASGFGLTTDCWGKGRVELMRFNILLAAHTY